MSEVPLKSYMLGDLVELSQGLAINAKTKYMLDEEGLPLLRITDLINETQVQFVNPEHAPEKCIAYENDIIYTRTGQVGLVYKERSGVIHNNCFKVIPNVELIDSDYLFWFLSQSKVKQYANDVASGSVQKDLNHSAFKSIPIDLPPLAYQRTVGPILNSFTNKIQLNRQTNQTLEHIAQAIFKSWFVNFEPTRAKIAARERWLALHESVETSSPTCYAEQLDTPSQNHISLEEAMTQAAMAAISGKSLDALGQLSPEHDAQGSANVAGGRMPGVTLEQLKTTASLFPDALVESELGEVPEGWGTQILEDIIELAYGKALKKTDRIDGEFPVYGSGGLTGTHNKSLVEGPGIIVGRKGTVGALFWEEQPFFPIDTVFYVKCKNDMTLAYSYYLLQTLGLEGMNTDAAVPGLNRNNVYRLEIPKVPVALVNAYTALVSSFRDKIKVNTEEIISLDTIRDGLLPKLLSGESTTNSTKPAMEAAC